MAQVLRELAINVPIDPGARLVGVNDPRDRLLSGTYAGRQRQQIRSYKQSHVFGPLYVQVDNSDNKPASSERQQAGAGC